MPDTDILDSIDAELDASQAALAAGLARMQAMQMRLDRLDSLTKKRDLLAATRAKFEEQLKE